VLDAVDLVSGFSGGSVVAAYFAAFGSAGLDSFEPDVGRRFREDINGGRRRFASFAPDAELFLVVVNLRDAEGEGRRQLLQVPTAFTIGNDEVTSLVAAGRSVLRASKEFQALKRSLGLPAAP